MRPLQVRTVGQGPRHAPRSRQKGWGGTGTKARVFPRISAPSPPRPVPDPHSWVRAFLPLEPPVWKVFPKGEAELRG